MEETLKRIQSHRGVVGVVVVNQEGEGPANAVTGKLIGVLVMGIN